jgi:hypothetical protein
MVNPFQISKPVEPEEIIGRGDEIDKLVALATEGNNARLVAPRRFGKTSVLRRVQAELPKGQWWTVYVDLLGIVTLGDLSNRIERAYEDQLRGIVGKWFAGLRASLRPTLTLGGGPVPVAGNVDLSGIERAGLEERLALPVRVYEKTGRRVHVVFDEFQELDYLEDHTDQIVRSEIQHHGNAASYVFAGSQLHMMEMMFTNPKRAFYGQAQLVSLPPLQAELLAEYVSSRFAESGKEVTSGALAGLLRLVRGHPQRAMAAAHSLWDSTADIADVEHWESARVSLMDDVADEMKSLWSVLSTNERLIVDAIARGESPYKEGNATSRGGAVERALVSLEGRGILARSSVHTEVIDPLFAAWRLDQR